MLRELDEMDKRNLIKVVLFIYLPLIWTKKSVKIIKSEISPLNETKGIITQNIHKCQSTNFDSQASHFAHAAIETLVKANQEIFFSRQLYIYL